MPTRTPKAGLCGLCCALLLACSSDDKGTDAGTASAEDAGEVTDEADAAVEPDADAGALNEAERLLGRDLTLPEADTLPADLMLPTEAFLAEDLFPPTAD